MKQMRRFMAAGTMLAAFLLIGLGCGDSGNPPQPKLSDEQIKELMKQGADQREGKDKRG
jgi:hypothetical protein